MSFSMFFLTVSLLAQNSAEAHTVLEYFEDFHEIRVFDAEGTEIVDNDVGLRLPVGSIIETGSSRAELILIPNGSILSLAEDSMLSIQSLSPPIAQNQVNAFLFRGSFRFKPNNIDNPDGRAPYSFVSDSSILRIRNAEVIVEEGNFIYCIEGVVEMISTDDELIIIRTGKYLDLTGQELAVKTASDEWHASLMEEYEFKTAWRSADFFE
jgi:hypothetical protein